MLFSLFFNFLMNMFDILEELLKGFSPPDADMIGLSNMPKSAKKIHKNKTLKR